LNTAQLFDINRVFGAIFIIKGGLMDLKSRGEKSLVRHLCPTNLETLKNTLGDELEIIQFEPKKQEKEDTKVLSLGSLVTTLPYRPRTSFLQ
jgi:hypothetical protein